MSLKYEGNYNYVLLDPGEHILPGDQECVGKDEDGNIWEPFESSFQIKVGKGDVIRRRIDKDVARKIAHRGTVRAALGLEAELLSKQGKFKLKEYVGEEFEKLIDSLGADYAEHLKNKMEKK